MLRLLSDENFNGEIVRGLVPALCELVGDLRPRTQLRLGRADESRCDWRRRDWRRVSTTGCSIFFAPVCC